MTFPRGDHNQLISSIKDKLLPLGDDVTFLRVTDSYLQHLVMNACIIHPASEMPVW